MPPSQPARQLALPESTRLPAAVTPWMGCTCRGQQQHNLASEQYCFAFGPPHASAAFLPARPIGGRHRRCRCAVEQPARRSTCAAEHQAIAPASQAPSSTPSKTHPTFRQVPPSAPRHILHALQAGRQAPKRGRVSPSPPARNSRRPACCTPRHPDRAQEVLPASTPGLQTQSPEPGPAGTLAGAVAPTGSAAL